MEETGYTAVIKSLLGIYTGYAQNADKHYLHFVFNAMISKGGETTPHGLLEKEWIRVDELGDLNVLNPDKLGKIINDYTEGRELPLNYLNEMV